VGWNGSLLPLQASFGYKMGSRASGEVRPELAKTEAILSEEFTRILLFGLHVHFPSLILFRL
jgi:hypothetical protein